MRFITFIACYALLNPCLYAQPGTVNMTPLQSLNLKPVVVDVPARFKSVMSGNYTVNLPEGYKARIFYTGGLSKPRFMAFDHKGVLHVSNMVSTPTGKIYALPDANNDGIADTAIVVADGFSNNHDVKFYKGHMYVTESRNVWKLSDNNNDGIYETRAVFIDSIAQSAPQPTGGHSTRTLLFDSINQKAYLSIGSLCNVCREDFRAVIEQYNEDGTGGRVYATGIRNAVGLALHPVTNRLWANNNGSDRQGDYIPPEWIDLIRENGFYGYPFAYANQVWFNFDAHSDYAALKPITSNDSVKVSKMIEPAGLIQAHTAPMALTFLNASFPASYRNGLITALRGSWNTPQNYKGYKLVYMDLTNSNDTTFNYAADFCTGFITDTINRLFWGRPVGLAINQQGDLFMSSDEGNRFVMHIYYDGPTGLVDETKNLAEVKVYPNPSSGNQLFIEIEQRNPQPITVAVYDSQGRMVKQQQANGSNTVIDIAVLAKGLYTIKVSDGVSVKTVKVVLEK